MDSEIEMDASGCWILKTAKAITEISMVLQKEPHKSLAYSLKDKATTFPDEREGAIFTWQIDSALKASCE